LLARTSPQQRGPKRIVKTGKTPMLEAVEWRKVE